MTINPHNRLRAARQALTRGHYKDALEGFLSFHQHALEHDPGLSGVRVSFALSSWSELAEWNCTGS
jgi:hypothetical protein